MFPWNRNERLVAYLGEKKKQSKTFSFCLNTWLNSRSCANSNPDTNVAYMMTCLSAPHIPFASLELPQTQQRRLDMTRTSALWNWGSHFKCKSIVQPNFIVSNIRVVPKKLFSHIPCTFHMIVIFPDNESVLGQL